MKGDVVVVPFPFSDLSATKSRPALVSAVLDSDDIILSQITSVKRKDSYSIVLLNNYFKSGTLEKQSVIRPNRLFTADKSLILYKVGSIKNNKLKDVEDKIVKIFRN